MAFGKRSLVSFGKVGDTGSVLKLFFGPGVEGSRLKGPSQLFLPFPIDGSGKRSEP